MITGLISIARAGSRRACTAVTHGPGKACKATASAATTLPFPQECNGVAAMVVHVQAYVKTPPGGHLCTYQTTVIAQQVRIPHLYAVQPHIAMAKIPDTMTQCYAYISMLAAGAEPFFPAGQPHRAKSAWRAHVAMAWWNRVMAKIMPSLPTVLPPGPRTENGQDFVALGHRVRPEHRAQLRQQWRAFVHDWGTMPEDAFEGRGIAILSGNLPYLVPSVIALKAIRRTGCKLPVEFWFPANEAPSFGVAMKLHRLGATVRKFPVPTTLTHVRAPLTLPHGPRLACTTSTCMGKWTQWPPCVCLYRCVGACSCRAERNPPTCLAVLGLWRQCPYNSPRGTALPSEGPCRADQGHCVQGAFFMKAIVVLLSSFKEVMMLDADQVPVADPTQLFDDPGFVETGALLWPDFWEATWAPDAPLILNVDPDDMPTKSFESGQMLFDKTRCSHPLLLPRNAGSPERRGVVPAPRINTAASLATSP